MIRKKPRLLSEQLAATERKVRAIYISTYIPRECGIATFTKDLTNAINLLNPHCLADIVAIDDEKTSGMKYDYPWEVKYKVDQHDLKSWLGAAEYINQSGAEVVSIQHEFGICGGNMGEYIVPFVEAITKPIVVTFHTVVTKPDEQVRHIISRLTNRADAIVVMVKTAVNRLTKIYKVDPKKIVVIPHGVPDITFGPTDEAKKSLGYENYNLISGFGLLSRGKGYETAIEAMPAIVAKYPKTKLLIIGETHPVVKNFEGETYREHLTNLAKKLKVSKHVDFINRYSSLEEIIEYLKATDIYITPFPGLDQITSGTLSYAIGAGKACISTPYLYAKEVIDTDRGLFFDVGDAKELARQTIKLLDHPRKRHEMAKKAYAYGRNMIWPNVALKHLDLFEIVSGKKDDPC